MATTFTAVAGGGNWNAAGTWDVGSSYPQSANGDTAVFNASSGNVSVNIAANCTTLNMTGYAGTLTFSNSLTVTNGATLQGTFVAASSTSLIVQGGGVTLAGTCAATGAGILTLLMSTAGQDMTSNGNTWPQALNLGGFTYSLVDAWTVTKLVTTAGSTKIDYKTDSSQTLTCNGGLTVSGNSGAGTAKIILGGGTWTGSAGYIQNDIDIAGSMAFSSTIIYKTGTLKFVSGSPNWSSNTLTLPGSCTLDLDGTTLNNVTLNAVSTTITLAGDLTMSGGLTISNTPIVISGSYDVYCQSYSITGTSVMTFPANQTFYVNQGTPEIKIGASTGSTPTLQASSGHFHLVYTGTRANQKIINATLTGVNASGNAAGDVLSTDHLFAINSTLTTTTNIIPVAVSDVRNFGLFTSGTATLAYSATGGRTDNGACTVATPDSTTDPMWWVFLVPTTASTPFTLSFYHKDTNPTSAGMTVTVYDTDDTTKLLNAGAVTLNDGSAYTQHTTASLTPTATGFCRVVLKMLKGSGATAFYLDDVAVA